MEIKTKNSTIIIDRDTNAQLELILQSKYNHAKKIIITDENVFNLWIENIITTVPSLSEAELIQLPAGEDTKCLEIVTQVWESLTDYEIGRHDLIINLGGGVITDLGGFIASTYKRGISFINIPTTLLAQVDASIGGKTGIDLGPYKNQIGTFAHPDYVLINPNYLKTLDDTHMLSGYAEMLKHGLIQSESHWTALKNTSPKNIVNNLDLIIDSIQIKKNIVEQDPFETNMRKSLNFGHTIGHGIEGYFLDQNNMIPHGYAVAWGIVAETYIAFKSGLLDKTKWDEIYYVISDVFPKLNLPLEAINQILELMKNDKKNADNEINFTLISDLGHYQIDQTCSIKLVKESLELVS